MKIPFFEELEALYQRLEQSTPEVCGNPCGDCRLCCTTLELNEHRVTSLELDYLESRAGSEKSREFLAFLGRHPDTICPYYDQGCTVYPWRPYSCRTFGHFRREDTPLPEVCVFRGQEAIFGIADHHCVLPESEELASLSRRYWAYRIPREQSEQALYQAAGLEEELAQAFDLLNEGRLEEALEVIARDSSSDPFSLYCKSLMCEEAGRPDLSYTFIRQALAKAPRSADLWQRAGFILLSLGQQDDACRALTRSLELHSAQPRLQRLLNLLLEQTHQYQGAQDPHSQARTLPSDGHFGQSEADDSL